jgi:hypothetical protein
MTGGRERDHYGRKDWRERVQDAVDGVRAHPRITAVVVVIVGGFALQLLLRPTYVTVHEVAPGDCLYVRAETAADDDPAAEPTIAAFAERAACDASHSHEVLWVRELGVYETPYPDDGALAGSQADCDRTLQERLGDEPGGDADAAGLTATVIAPSRTAWAAGARAGLCTVSRTDGGFLDRPLSDLATPDGG